MRSFFSVVAFVAFLSLPSVSFAGHGRLRDGDGPVRRLFHRHRHCCECECAANESSETCAACSACANGQCQVTTSQTKVPAGPQLPAK